MYQNAILYNNDTRNLINILARDCLFTIQEAEEKEKLKDVDNIALIKKLKVVVERLMYLFLFKLIFPFSFLFISFIFFIG